ncbi:hypothetical protein A2115_01720 [Candidatus Woesebacteria bacterium GWA1_41_8]|uniref:ParB/Sulfiredoxin domain-containing protein n=1 Tax=Candidatus Woesebacteria bacterium GWA1_41_8 TaxID=1802471 RepID=A0A1F7WJN2_9BACT|nr:MAG: hypothetical protein A2115_01720 [Candidatus Woesebacteria bacterium GWA1_41_8]
MRLLAKAEMKKKIKPKIIEEVGFDFHWAEEKVWKLNVPVEGMDIGKLAWHFDIPFWWTENGYYDFKPIWVINEPDKYPERVKRVMSSNLKYPLDIMYWKDRWLLLDVLHRLVKAKMLGFKKVKVRKIPRKFIPLIEK